MATPHVAGAWAVLKQLSPGASVATLLSHLQSTGKPITDADNGITKPRIRLLSASTRIADTGLRPGARLPAGRTAAWRPRASASPPARALRATGTITLNGLPTVPNGAIVQHAALYWMTIGGPDDTAVFNGVSRTGTLVGASKDTCWNINQLGAQPRLPARVPDRHRSPATGASRSAASAASAASTARAPRSW